MIYRDLGLSRSLAATGEKLSKSTKLMGDWSTKHGWRARAMEWDRTLDKRRREQALKAVADMKRRHLALAEGMQRLAQIELRKKLKAAEEAQSEGKLASRDIVQLVESATKLERLNLDMPSEIIEERTTLNEAELDSRIEQMVQAIYEDED